MSTILKALKKLDDDRRADAPGRTLEEQVLAAGAGARVRPRGMPRSAMLGGAAAAFAVVGALAFAWWQRAPKAEETAATAPAPVAATAHAEPAPRASVAATRPPAAPIEQIPASEPLVARMETPSSDAAQPALETPQSGSRPSAAPVAAPALTAAATAEAPHPSIARSESSRPPTRSPKSPARAKTTLPIPQPARQREDAEEAISVLPPASRSEIAAEPEALAESTAAAEPVSVIPPRPEIWVERTQWHPTPEKRLAVVRFGTSEPRELREGDAVDGVVVKEIKPSGVIFLRGGDEWKRGVGSD